MEVNRLQWYLARLKSITGRDKDGQCTHVLMELATEAAHEEEVRKTRAAESWERRQGRWELQLFEATEALKVYATPHSYMRGLDAESMTQRASQALQKIHKWAWRASSARTASADSLAQPGH